MKETWIAFWVLVLLLHGAAFFPLNARADEPAPPAIVAKTLDGATFDLSALRGKVVIVHFWAVWCGPCKEEMPVLSDFYVKYQARGVAMIGLSIDRPRDRDKVKAYMHDYLFPAGLASDMAANDLGLPDEIPVTYIFDKKGRMREVLMPQHDTLSLQQLTGAVLPLMTGDGP